MNKVKYHRKGDFKEPVLIVGWPGMGNVAIGVVEYLKRALKTELCAEILMDQQLTLDSVAVEDGLVRFADPPGNIFYYAKKENVIIYEGEAQLPGQIGLELIHDVLDVSEKLGVSCIYSGASFPMPVSYKDDVEIYAATNHETMREMVVRNGIKVMEGGHISGLNGLILGFAADRGMDAVCLLATMPQYAISMPNPRASTAIIEALSKIIGFHVSVDDYADFTKEMDEKMAIIEEKVKEVMPEEGKHEPHQGEKKTPDYILERIERLFEEAKRDRKNAMLLKRELDRWDLYKAYEDRFLDLFREGQ